MKIFKSIFILIFISLFIPCPGSAKTKMAGHDMSGHGNSSERIGNLFHESMKDGYMLSYYLMDMREMNQKKDAAHAGHGAKQMDKPHHIMVYIMDKDHNPVEKGKVGFLIKNHEGNKQKLMGMAMSKGFGITADMREKGTYTITTKAVLGDVKLMDTFTHQME
ncbi:hypothetical protein [Desulfospira joergensenii]|uniref:hypothetical protein n=1 Tax=Desulfospira joergensenii TaxID=53329 RepID=UPI0003B38FA4|nr:hypothetical protein [Desulfospira joergensenii]